MPYDRGSVHDGIERGNVRLRLSEQEQYERIIAYVRDNPGCRRVDVEQAMHISATYTLIAIAIHSGRIKGDGRKPEHLEVEE